MAWNRSMPFISSSRTRCCTRRSIESFNGEVGPFGRKARRRSVLQPLRVDVFLHAGDADIVDDWRSREYARGHRPVRIDQRLFLGHEADAGDAQPVHRRPSADAA